MTRVNRFSHILLFLALVFALCLINPGFMSQASAADNSSSGTTGTQKKKGLVQKGDSYYYYKSDGTKLTKSWKTVNGKRYYFRKSGKAAVGPFKVKGVLYLFNQKGQLRNGTKSRFVTYKNSKYYVDKKGRVTTGWFVVKGKLYYATSTGKRSTKTREGIKFSEKKGYAKSSTASNLKIKTIQVVDKITSSKMSQSQKLRACWNYMVGSGWSYRAYSSNFESGWQKKCAYSMLTTRKGNCKSFACAFAALAAEVGYDPYVIWGTVPAIGGGSTTHCWVKINGKYYDPEGQWNGWNKGVYGASSYNAQLTVSRTFRFKTY